MIRVPLLALALAVLVAASAQLARADDAPPQGAAVTIAPSDGGAARTVGLADLADRFDVHDATYTLREADGTTTTLTVADGISLTALLAVAGLDADAFTYVEVPGADGSGAILLRDDLGGTDEGPPVVWADEQGVHFLRPSRGDGDVNDGDLVTLPDGPIAISLRTGDPLVPRISVSTLRARPRERIGFGATLAVGRLAPGMDFEWYFDGTGTASGANVSHRFPSPGSYLVLLYVVRGSGETVSSTETVRVRVVRSHERRSSGGAHGSGERQDAGSGDGGTGGDGSSGGSGGGGLGTSGSDAPAPAYVPPPAASPALSLPPAPAPARGQAPARRRPRGDLVSGTLIASASAAATPAGGTQVARAAVHGAASDGPLHLPIGVWVGAGLALLLALGWVLESRHTLPFWQP